MPRHPPFLPPIEVNVVHDGETKLKKDDGWSISCYSKHHYTLIAYKIVYDYEYVREYSVCCDPAYKKFDFGVEKTIFSLRIRLTLRTPGKVVYIAEWVDEQCVSLNWYFLK
jgi:hypothetical protein